MYNNRGAQLSYDWLLLKHPQESPWEVLVKIKIVDTVDSGGAGGRRGGLMISALDSGANAPGSSLGWGHCVVLLGKTLYSHGASLHPGV